MAEEFVVSGRGGEGLTGDEYGWLSTLPLADKLNLAGRIVCQGAHLQSDFLNKL